MNVHDRWQAALDECRSMGWTVRSTADDREPLERTLRYPDDIVNRLDGSGLDVWVTFAETTREDIDAALAVFRRHGFGLTEWHLEAGTSGPVCGFSLSTDGSEVLNPPGSHALYEEVEVELDLSASPFGLFGPITLAASS